MSGLRRLLTGAVATAVIASWTVAVPLATPGSAEALIVVDTTAPGVNASDGKCSLAEAIYAANFNASLAIASSPPDVFVSTSCTAGHIGVDTISLPAGAVFSFSAEILDLHNPMGPTATPIVFSPIVVEGHGAVLQHTGSAPFRAFAVGYAYVDANPGGTPDVASGTGDLDLRDLHVKDFDAKGGDGKDGGGGGLGAGGAIYVRDASLLVERSTFTGNRAQGGNGGIGSHGAGGGGGGLGGDGGVGSGQSYDGFDASGGGGGGGGGGNGGSSVSTGPYGQVRGGSVGGGGGGTVTDGGSDNGTSSSRAGGLACGGEGGEAFGDEDGDSGCEGGGGGGGERVQDDALSFEHGAGGGGGYGGGGGGGGYNQPNSQDDPDIGPGGHGGFGGGGGAGATGDDPGNAGFGGGGGGGTDSQGQGGTFGGDGGKDNNEYGFDVTGPGGGGAGLGGAIFGDGSTIVVINSTFTGNSISRGVAGNGGVGADKGADAGGALFAVDGNIAVSGSTIYGNESTGSGAGLVVYRSTRGGHSASLNILNSIIARNDITPNTRECYVQGAVVVAGSGNLMTNNFNCPGVASTEDPQLGTLAIEAPGLTPTLPLVDTSPAYDTGDDTNCESTDQRGVSRPRGEHCDIGAYEYNKPSADLAVTTANVGTAVAGANVSYTVDVVNNGPTAAADVTVTDTLPSGTSYVGVSGGGFSCVGTAPVTCSRALLAEGTSAQLTFTVAIPATTADGTTLTNAVSVASTTPDPLASNNTSSVDTTVITRADLAAAVTGPAEPVAGTDVTYPITVTNNGPSNATTPVLSASVATGTTFVSFAKPTGWTCTQPAVGASGAISCSATTLAPTGTVSFTLVVHLPASATDGSSLCSSASASSQTTDPTSSNDTGQSCGTVVTRADLSVTQTATTSGKPGKGTATFVVQVPNAGPSDSQGVSLSVTSSLFVGPPPLTVTTAGGTCTVNGQTVVCTWTTLAAAATGQVTISVPWRSSVGQVCASSSVTAVTTDPVATNNTGSVCTNKR